MWWWRLGSRCSLLTLIPGVEPERVGERGWYHGEPACLDKDWDKVKDKEGAEVLYYRVPSLIDVEDVIEHLLQFPKEWTCSVMSHLFRRGKMRLWSRDLVMILVAIHGTLSNGVKKARNFDASAVSMFRAYSCDRSCANGPMRRCDDWVVSWVRPS